mmetsp:Transcript_11474/g.15923  ORF Transcript_11474/g.15923 Transcript_11474/m.15923 type:complete len:530 (-) Transcript_11474:230-1819(-)|eukprot:CAMPEP_0185735138 /NCGR_PEP_ID=MMETSP1171-20130828/24435_1 /TAXON_ID=374046 /ORGANISM="Helicotheca tamensis, Strain CCMP826" /LENGTH=529 /DNA_ID=CAMNT_0028405331 /DNA_START=56 /DNA_END=1645 /DNA_ORIENTATION=-
MEQLHAIGESAEETNLHIPASTWNTKIVCTVGPASSSEETLEQMINAGMDVVRLNFSHGLHEKHREAFDMVRSLSSEYNNQVAILCDIQGPKIRTGLMEAGFELRRGDVVRVTPDEVAGNKGRFQIKYESLLEDLDKDDVIFINDGTVKLVVLEQDLPNRDLVCECEAAGAVSDHKGCNMPSGKLSVDVLTPKDAKDLEFIADLNPEYVAASFVGTAADVQKVRAKLASCGNPNIKVVAKIERPVALENLDEIIDEADALMVARGDLGVEIDAWDVPRWQKDIINRCNRESKPVIVATQMMESMCVNSRPTRAEASDVYNAVLDGADAVMLSAESCVGKYPVEAVKIMDEVVRVAQSNMPARDPADYDSADPKITETICHAAYTLSSEFAGVDYDGKIIVITESGRVARLISKYRPPLPILAFSESMRAVRELALVWGVRAHHLPEIHDFPLEERAIKAIDTAVNIGYLNQYDTKVCVLTGSAHSGTGFYTGVYDVSALAKQHLIQGNQGWYSEDGSSKTDKGMRSSFI